MLTDHITLVKLGHPVHTNSSCALMKTNTKTLAPQGVLHMQEVGVGTVNAVWFSSLPYPLSNGHHKLFPWGVTRRLRMPGLVPALPNTGLHGITFTFLSLHQKYKCWFINIYLTFILCLFTNIVLPYGRFVLNLYNKPLFRQAVLNMSCLSFLTRQYHRTQKPWHTHHTSYTTHNTHHRPIPLCLFNM